MGEWDVFCAICGGPVVEVHIATTDRSEIFKASQRGEEQKLEPDEDRLLWDERRTYDREIITKEDTMWATKVMVLGLNPNAKGLTNTFLAGFCTYDGDGSVSDSPGFKGDHNFDNHRDYTFECYANYVNDDGVVFPFHKPCYNLFRRRVGDRINGEFPENGLVILNKDILYAVMNELICASALRIDYGTPSPQPEYLQTWESNAGEEIFAADPSQVEGLEDRIREKVTGGFYVLPQHEELELSYGVREDPFRRLPFDILVKVAELVEDPISFLNWAKASWFANAFVRNAPESFWKMAIRKQMGWFTELLSCLDDEDICRSSNMRAVFLWAACLSEPQLDMKGGDFLRLANRRRIWTTPCAELVNRYCSKLPRPREADGDEDSVSSFLEMLLTRASHRRLYTVMHNKGMNVNFEKEKCFLIDEWDDTYAKSQTIEAFFRSSDGFLVGIVVTTARGDRRLLGSPNEGSGRFEAIIPAEDWICGIVLHIPAIEFVGTTRDDVLKKTSPKGVTIVCNSGRELQLGETDRGHPTRALTARPGRQIVGLVAQMGINIPSELIAHQIDEPPELTEHYTDAQLTMFARMGLITLSDEALSDQCILPDKIIRRRHPCMDEIMWRDDGARFFGVPYWNSPNIRILTDYEVGVVHEDQTETHQDLVLQEGFVWAKDATELRQLKKLSIFTTYSDTRDANLAYRICGLGAEFSAEHPEGRRVVGLEGKTQADDRHGGQDPDPSGPRFMCNPDTKVSEIKGDGDFRIDIDIDGPGGEYITEVLFRWSELRSGGSMATLTYLKFGTNRGRVIGLGLEVSDETRLTSLKARPYRSIIGLLVSFAHSCGESKHEKLSTYKEVTSLAALSMRLGIDEETIEESSDEEDDYYDYDYDEDSDEEEEEDDEDEDYYEDLNMNDYIVHDHGDDHDWATESRSQSEDGNGDEGI